MSANTSTIDLIDDFIPVGDDREAKTRSRRSSAIHIKVYRVGSDCDPGKATATPKVASSLVEGRGKMPGVEQTRTSESAEPQQQPATGRSQKQSKKKAVFSKMQTS